MPIVVALLAVVPALALALILNLREPKPPPDSDKDALNVEDPRYDGMNKQGLGWGTRDNDRGGL